MLYFILDFLLKISIYSLIFCGWGTITTVALPSPCPPAAVLPPGDGAGHAAAVGGPLWGFREMPAQGPHITSKRMELFTAASIATEWDSKQRKHAPAAARAARPPHLCRAGRWRASGRHPSWRDPHRSKQRRPASPFRCRPVRQDCQSHASENELFRRV